MNILGINSVYHESAAALLVDGELVAAIEEERFNRIKHGKEADWTTRINSRSVRSALPETRRLTAARYRSVAYSFDPKLRRTRYRAEWWDPRAEETFQLRLGQVRGVAEEILGRRSGKDFILCLTIWHMPLRRISRRASIAQPSSPSTGSARWPARRSAKAVGTRIQSVETSSIRIRLASYGRSSAVILAFRITTPRSSWAWRPTAIPRSSAAIPIDTARRRRRDYAIDPGFPRLCSRTKFARMETMFGPPRGSRIPEFCRDMPISRRLAGGDECAVIALVRRLKRKVPFDNLCIAGGVALNCVTNEVVRRSGEFSKYSYPPRRTMPAPRSAPPLPSIAQTEKSVPSEATLRRIWGLRSTGANSGGGQIGRSHLPAKQSPRARCCGHDRRRQDRRLVSGSHGVRAPRARQPFAARRSAPAGHAQYPQSKGQAPRGLPALCAERHGRTRRRMV